jgi:hypothetical protein
MDPKYLPSKQFIARLTILGIACILVFGIYAISSYFKNRAIKSGAIPLVVQDVVQKDTNKNGIADWEESLWGLDPTKNGENNKLIITSKQQALAKANNTNGTLDSGTSAENEILAKQFFATIVSLQQSGNLTDASLQSVADTIGNQVKATPVLDIYTKSMQKTVKADFDSIFVYKKSLKALFLKYQNKNIGDELSFIATVLKNNDSGAVKAISDVAEAYHNFGTELIKIPVPSTMAPTILSLANDYEKTSVSVDGLSKIISDPIIAMRALTNYKKYNDELVNIIDSLSGF